MSEASNRPSILLSSDERERFASWLEADAESDDQLAEQLKKIAHADFAHSRKADAKAKRRVAQLLRSVEDVSL